jgi:hypothetical protein
MGAMVCHAAAFANRAAHAATAVCAVNLRGCTHCRKTKKTSPKPTSWNQFYVLLCNLPIADLTLLLPTTQKPQIHLVRTNPVA